MYHYLLYHPIKIMLLARQLHQKRKSDSIATFVLFCKMIIRSKKKKKKNVGKTLQKLE